jgi:hypothetical protein
VAPGGYRAGVDPHKRPASLDPRELGFTPQHRVPWLSPLLLLRTGVRTSLAMIFGAYLDKRELQAALPARWHHLPGTDGEVWFDYVADLGDGFDATYSVAHLLGQPSLTVDGHDLPRGDLLIMGGDLVYPTASMEQYANRTKGPYRAALPEPPVDGPQPTLLALPANHDWYDGLTAFLRLFVGERAHRVGGWRLEQTRSYFAVELPHHWWVFALDEAFGGYFDDPQLVYFEQAAAKLGPDDRVIVLVPEPTWSKDDPSGYDSLDFFLRAIIAPTGARVPVMIAGDQHHYARYAGPERQLITCGGGGAFLTATHTIKDRLTVPPRESLVRRASPSQGYDLAARFPSAARSRRMAWGIFGRLPLRNPGFAALVGGVHTLLMLAIAGAHEQLTQVEERLVTIPLVAMILVVLGGAVALAYTPTGGRKRTRHLMAGLLHGAGHAGLGVAGAWAWLQLPFHDWTWPVPLLAAALLYLPVAGLVATQLVAAYLLVGSAFGINVNELFAAQGIEDGKSFLRMHIGSDGALTIYPVGVDPVCQEWVADPETTRPDASWIVPARPGTLHGTLIEPPVTTT